MSTTPNFKYAEYLASREWALLREQVRERSKGWCERCAVGKHEDTHHLTYERIGHESLADLLGVCRGCHEFLSGKSAVDPANEVVCLVVAVSKQGQSGFKPHAELKPGVRFVGFATAVRIVGDFVSRMPTWTDEQDVFIEPRLTRKLAEGDA